MHLRNGVHEPGMSVAPTKVIPGQGSGIGSEIRGGKERSPHTGSCGSAGVGIVQSRAGKVDSSMEKCPVLCVQGTAEPPKSGMCWAGKCWGKEKGFFYQISVSMENSSPF